MKKQCLVMILLVLLLFLVTTSAFAANLESKNISLSPANGSSIEEGNINWSASGNLSLSYDSFFEEWIDSAHYEAVKVELYRTDTSIVEELVQTLYSKNYNKKTKVEFSANGTVWLSPGSYRIKIVATANDSLSFTRTVAKNDFTVYSKKAHVTKAPVTKAPVTKVPVTKAPVTKAPVTKAPVTKAPVASSSVHDIGIPNLNGRTYYEGDMNIAVLWVQQQMKQTRKYYQNDGSRWDVTGNLGDHTMEEIARFMQDNGYRNHDGHVDQTVINTFASYLGNNVSPVLVGGFYDKMDTIMIGGSAGSMKRIDKNSSSTSIKWVQCCLSKLGYYHGSINGRFDSATISAVHAFQEYAGFVKRDYVTLGVARDMILFCNNRGCDLSDLP